MLGDLQVELVQLREPIGDHPFSVEPHAHRQVVHTRPHQRLDARELGWTAGERRAEDHVVPAAQVAEEDGPRPLDDRVEGHALGTGKALEGRGGGDVQPRGRLADGVPGIRHWRHLPGKRCRRRESLEALLPEEARIGRGVGQPTDIGAVLRGLGELRRRPSEMRCVGRSDVAKDERPGPAVDIEVVGAPDEPVIVICQADERQAVQGRHSHVEAALAVGVEERLQLGLCVGNVPARPVQLGPGSFDPPLHHLERLVPHVGDEGGPQYRVACHGRLPRFVQRGGVQRAPEAEDPLLEPDLAASGLHRKEQALHRREGIDVL